MSHPPLAPRYPFPSQEMKYKTFMEGFIAAVGIPLERASECVFKLDGDRLDPEGTPQVCRGYPFSDFPRIKVHPTLGDKAFIPQPTDPHLISRSRGGKLTVLSEVL